MQIRDLASDIQALGLSPKQSKVLVAGMMLGPSAASKLAEQAGISRTSAYDILDELGKLGLVQRSEIDGLTLFDMVDYQGLQLWLSRQRAELAERQDRLKMLESELVGLTRRHPDQQPRVRFVAGTAGLEVMQAEALRKARPGSTIYSATNHDETLKRYPDQLTVNPQRRLRKRLKSRQLYFNSEAVIPTDPALLKETQRLTEPIAGDITLYEDQALLISYEGDWTGMMIESRPIVAALRTVFERAWQSEAKKLSK